MPDRNAHEIPLAIVGMGCRLPGADNLEQYWKLLIEGRTAIAELPADRLDQDMYFDPREGARGKTSSKLGAIVNSRDFDRRRCPIPEELARSVDNVHLLMCDVAASAVRDAGMDPFHIPLRNTGVFIGHAQGSTLGGDQTYATCIVEAADFLREVPAFADLPAAEQEAVINELIATVRRPLPKRTFDSPDVSASLVAGTISKAFGLTGPYFALNSACASSLHAMLLGARALQLGHVDMAIVGGASDLKSDTLVLFSNARAMSATGSRPFDADADGLICGEGYVAVVMKTLDRAMADGDRVWAVVRGLGISSDGKGKSLWAPRKEGQVKAMERAYRGGLKMGDIEYIEAHATATQLGDATELNTLTEMLGPALPPGKRIPITSVKANIGHTLETAGLAGLIKAVLALHHETVPPAVGVRNLNPKIDWQKAPVYVPTAPVPWPKRADGKPRRAGINAFGIGGLNMHVVVDEFLPTTAGSPNVSSKEISAQSPADDSIAVIGLGCVLPGASKPSEFWDLLASGCDPKVSAPPQRLRTDLAIKDGSLPEDASTVGGFITDFVYDWKRHKLPPKQVAQADPLQFMLLEAADQAMQDAGYDRRPIPRENVGVVVGTEFGGDFAFQLQLGLRLPELERHIERLLVARGVSRDAARKGAADYSEALLKHWPALIDETGSFSTSSLASRIGKTWDLMGGAVAIDAGETSGLAALAVAADMLRGGDCDLMLCAAGQRRMALPEYETLAINGLLAKGSPRSLLEPETEGYVPGEGVVVLLLKRLADATRDGDRIHAILHAVEAAHDQAAWGSALKTAIERAYSAASNATSPTDVSVLEFEPLGGRQWASQTVATLRSAHQSSSARMVPMSSLTALVGNTQGASSLVSLLKGILEVNHGELPPTFASQRPSTTIAPLRPTADGRRIAAVAACSRGLAYHAVLESATRVPVEQPTAQPPVSGAVKMAELEKFLINFVVEQTGYPPEVVELDANLEADLGIDSIKKAQMFGELQEYFDVTPTDNLTLDDFPTLRHIVNFLAAVPQKGASAPESSSYMAWDKPHVAQAHQFEAGEQVVPAAKLLATQTAEERHAQPALQNATSQEELEKFLINFVVEQTGYPPEVVELDANLEADLGIDSIKKAQMFGELQEYFDVTPTDNLTLDDFPTLRHIVDFLAAVPQKVAQAEPTETSTSAATKEREAQPDRRDPVPSAQKLSGWQICRFGAKNREGLARAVESALQQSANWESFAVRKFTADDRYRLAVVADGPTTLSTRLAMAAKQMNNPAAQTVLEQQGIFCREMHPETQIVFLFPGQGSQYAGMLKQLIQDAPAIADEQRRIDDLLRGLGLPAWTQLAWGDASQLGKDVWTTQIAMLMADVLMLAALRERGIEADVVAGHSYGEYAALLAAGCWDLQQAVRVTGVRCKSIDASPSSRGGMLATTAPPATIEQLASLIDGPLFVANYNAPDQSVVGGSKEALSELEGLLQGSQFDARMLPVPSPFHTPLLRDAAELFRGALSRETFATPQIPLYSVATNTLVANPREIAENLVAHLTSPVRYADLVLKLAETGPVVFVEVGPQQALTKLNRRILPPEKLVGIACDNPSRPGIEQLARVQALLECTGALDRQRLRPDRSKTRKNEPIAKSGEVWRFDATVTRRERMRRAAAKETSVPRTPVGDHPNQPIGPTPTVPPKVAMRATSSLPPAPAPASRQNMTHAVQSAVLPPPPLPKATVGQGEPAETVVAAGTPKERQSKPALQNATSQEELEKFLINFVVEQTGYPPEVVELDANLEADLGIDSIKKAQMFGELQEYFDVTPTDNLTLDDFPTLRHIVDFLAAVPQKEGSPSEVAQAGPAAIAGWDNAAKGEAGPPSDADERIGGPAPVPRRIRPTPQEVEAERSAVMHLHGTPYEMGFQQGLQKKSEIRRALRRVADLADRLGADGAAALPSRFSPDQFFSADELEEIRGIAEAVQTPIGSLVALNRAVAGALPAMPTTPQARLDAVALLQSVAQERQLPSALVQALDPIVTVRESVGGERVSVATFAGIAGDLFAHPRPSRRRMATQPATEGGATPTAKIAPTSDDLLTLDAASADSSRFVMRLTPSPWKTQPADFPKWTGAVAILGDNLVADALDGRIAASGATVVRLRQNRTIGAAVAELEVQWARQPIGHLLLVSHRDESGVAMDGKAWDEVIERRALLPYFVCQRFVQLASDAQRLDQSTIAAVTDLGGDLGFSGQIPSPESGFLTGLMKALFLELNHMRGHRRLFPKAIDAPRWEDPRELAANVCRELASGTNDYELSFVDGKRYLQVALPVEGQMETDAGIRPGGTWVLTGGARGITAECGLALGKRFGLKLHLIGASPRPTIDPAWQGFDEKQLAELRARVMLDARSQGQKPNETWADIAKAIEIDRNLAAFARAGISATYHACDISDREALAKVLDSIRRTDGPIDGIVHGAGIDQACRFEKKTERNVRATVNAKIVGAYNLMLLTEGDPVRHFLAFGSISGRLGSNGQTDYAAASDMLVKLVSWYRGQKQDCRAIGFHWHPWGEVGMASRPETQAILKASDVRLMPKETGIRHLLRELYTKTDEAEIFITDRDYHQRYYSKDVEQIAQRNDLLGNPSRPPEKPEQAAAHEDKTTAQRIGRAILRMVDAPLDAADNSRPLPSSVLLLGANADADALEKRLVAQGVLVERLPVEDDLSISSEVLEIAWKETQFRCLILATSRDCEAGQLDNQEQVARRTQRGFYLPYGVARRWFQLLSESDWKQPATLVALTSLGGDFGFVTPPTAPEGGAMAGLLKSIFVEDARYDHSRFRVKIIDAPAAEEPSQLAEAVCRELQSNRPEVEVAWSSGRRTVVGARREAVQQVARDNSAAVGAGPPSIPRGTWVVTGGARGITAAAALELGRRYALKLHLVGKSPAPQPGAAWLHCSEEELKKIKASVVRRATLEGRSPTDEWDRVKKDREIQQSLDKFAAAGVSAVYHSCDVGNWQDLKRVLEEIRLKDGPIDGIIHGAGYAKGFRFGNGLGTDVRPTIAPKVDGTLALMHLTRHDPLKYFIAFGSLSGRFGGNGLGVYAAANDMLAKLCGWFRARRPECRTTCLHWQTWDQIGMAMLSDGIGITKNAFKMNFISPEDGVAHFVAEIEAGAPESEVLISDDYFQRAFYPYELPDAPATANPATTHARLPLIDAWLPAADGGRAEICFDPVADPFLTQHRLKGKPFLPGVIGIEAVAEAAQLSRPGQLVCELTKVRIVNGLLFHSEEPIAARVSVTDGGRGLACRLLTELRDRRGRLIDAARLHVEATVPSDASTARLQADPPGEPPQGWVPHPYLEDGLMFHGPAFRRLKEIAYQEDGGWGRIAPASPSELAGLRGAEGWLLPPAVLDSCLVACGGYTYLSSGGVVEVPYEFDRLCWSRRPGDKEPCVVRVWFRGRTERGSQFDFTLYGLKDEPLLMAIGYRTIRVGGDRT